MPKYTSAKCAYCARPFLAQVRRSGVQKHCSRECFGRAHTFRSIASNPQKQRILEILFDEGLITKDDLRKRLGLPPRRFGRALAHLCRDHKGALFTYQIGLTERGKALFLKFMQSVEPTK